MSDITWSNDTRRLSDLVPWEHNPKRMTKKQADGLRLSIERFGFAVPFLVSPDGDIYDGHQRQTLMGAIKEHGPNAVVDVRVSSRPLTDDERRELVVRLKQNQAGWDFDMLPNLYEREELLEWGFEPEELGMFPDDEKPEDPGAQVDKAEELRVKWGVEPGQLWQLGEHRLICGDCTDAATVARVMGGEDVQMLATDPPFAITGSATGAEDMSGINIIRPFYQLWIGHFAALMPLFAHAYICCDFRTYSMIDSTAQQHLRLKNCVIWDKGGGGLGSMYQNCHEMIWFGVREERKRIKANKTGQRTVTGEPNIWRYTPPTFATGKDAPLHTANKPLEMFERMIRNSSDPNDIVADPFSGSGTTLIACERLGRRCRAVEIAPGYVAVALQRFYDMTGIEPVLLEPGNSDLTVISNG